MQYKVLGIWLPVPKWLELMTWQRFKWYVNEVIEWLELVTLSSIIIYSLGKVFKLW